jgi:hypothetical protein
VSANLQALEAEVLQLAPADRARLFEFLIASMDTDREVELAWEEEADLREAALDSEGLDCVCGPRAIAQLRARLAT